MASGDTLFVLEPIAYSPPATIYATLDFLADTSTPAANIPVLDFDATTQEWAYWHRTMPSHYDGGGVTISWKGGTDNTSTGTLEIEVGAITIADATDITSDLGLDGTTFVGMIDTPPATPQDKMNQSQTGTLTHANIGSPAVGARMIWVARRDVATDTNTGDLQLQEILILET